MIVTEENIEDIEQELIDSGFEVIGEREVNRNQVTRYIASGERILDVTVIAGENIPVVPMYGERTIIEGEIH